MTFIIGIFQFHCKSKCKQVKRNKITRGTCKSNIMSPCLQGRTQFKSNLYLDKIDLKNEC